MNSTQECWGEAYRLLSREKGNRHGGCQSWAVSVRKQMTGQEMGQPGENQQQRREDDVSGCTEGVCWRGATEEWLGKCRKGGKEVGQSCGASLCWERFPNAYSYQRRLGLHLRTSSWQSAPLQSSVTEEIRDTTPAPSLTFGPEHPPNVRDAQRRAAGQKVSRVNFILKINICGRHCWISLRNDFLSH